MNQRLRLVPARGIPLFYFGFAHLCLALAGGEPGCTVMQPPVRSAHALASHGLAKAILIAWTIGATALALGLTSGNHLTTGGGCAMLLAGVALTRHNS